MSSKPALTPTERADLVAFLDGELDPQASRQLEAKLQCDPSARAEADTLRKTWELLDCLPQPTPSATFTDRLVQRVSGEMPIVGRAATKRWRPWLLGIGWVVAVGVAGTLGFFGGRLLPHARSTVQADTLKSQVQNPPSDPEATWINQLPKADRERVRKAQGEARATLIAALHKQENKRQEQWQRAESHWNEFARGQHTNLNKLPGAVRLYVDDFLRPLLSPAEQKQIQNADGTPQLLPTLHGLAKKHPVILPGPKTGIDAPRKLPAGVWKQLVRIENGALRKQLQEERFKWPDFAIWVSYVARREHVALPRQLGPCRPSQFDTPTRDFIWNLLPHLDPNETKRLHNAEGNWPLYPQRLAELAAHHGMTVPGGVRFNLPGGPEFWNWWQGKPK
jgi:hypothetical protein